MSASRLKAPVLVVALACLAWSGAAPAETARQRFLRAERAIDAGHGNEARQIMSGLTDYPLFPYLELALAGRELDRLPQETIARLLTRHEDVPAALPLRRRWLERLAREGRWALLAAQYRDDGHTASACLRAEASWRTGDTADAWARVAALWPTGQSLPDACDAVLAAWRDAGELTPARGWTRAALAVEGGDAALARYLARFLDRPHRALLDAWLSLRAAPDGLAGFARAGARDDADRQRVLLNVFSRVAWRNPDQGRGLWRDLEAVELPDRLRARLRELLGEALASARQDDALQWLAPARSRDALVARAVMAILTDSRADLRDAITAMPGDESGRDRWRYWGARALEELDPPAASERLRALAGERSYYGFLAADRLAVPYAFAREPIAAGDAELEAVADMPAARRAREWLALERPEEARREWHRLMGQLDRDAQRCAALLAHRWGWHEAAIRSAAAAEHWGDLDVRFPLAHEAQVRRAASASHLAPARIYAVVRQESAFMRDIRSSAGAVGLMQLMPSTARTVARRARLARPGLSALLDPGENLLLGSLYLARLEQRYGGHPVLASAAYNAGPARVRQWLPRHGKASGEVWIEAIPFRETRRYVRSVLTYQVIYAEQLGQRPPRISELMPEVSAR